MHRSFGIETHPSSSASWDKVKKGPALAEVRDHLRKVATYRQMFR